MRIVSCAQICQELGYSEGSIIRSNFDKTAPNAELVVDQQSVDEDSPSFGQSMKPRGVESDIYGQVEGVREDTDILLGEECKEPLSTHKMWDIDD